MIGVSASRNPQHITEVEWGFSDPIEPHMTRTATPSTVTPRRASKRNTSLTLASISSVQPRHYLYSRFSSAKQAKGTSLARQAKYAAATGDRFGLPLDTSLTFRDEGLSAYSGKHIKQGTFGLFLKAIELGMIAPGSVLEVEALDRISRDDTFNATYLLMGIIRAGVRVYTAMDGEEYSLDSIKQDGDKLKKSIDKLKLAHEESANKGKRVGASLVERCEQWEPGQHLGGKYPAWLKWDDRARQFSIDSKAAAALRGAIGLYLRGYGPRRIFDTLTAQGIELQHGFAHQGRFYEVMRNRALIGERVIKTAEKTYTLPGYYPAVLTPEEFEQMQLGMTGRKINRTGAVSEIPQLFTGLRICVCGHCGKSMVAQNITNRCRADGSFPDAARRLNCGGAQSPQGCRTNLSTSIGPIESALLQFGSDQMNLDSLRASDSGAHALAAKITQAEQRYAELEAELKDLQDSYRAGQGRTLAKMLAAAEREQDQITTALMGMKREYDALVRTGSEADAESWAALIEGVAALDYDARMAARGLIYETFAKIVVYLGGTGGDEADYVDLELVSRQGMYRYLRIHRKTGEWIQGGEIDAFAALPGA
jgi:Resolvase, N terminal domain/Recombinase